MEVRFSDTRPMKALVAALSLLTMSTIAAEGPVFHVVHFKFKADAKPEDIKKVETEFAALKGKIKEVESIDWGTNSSPEGLNDGFTHCWIVKFKDEKARDAYLVHPEHKAFVSVLKPVLEKPFVVDFIPKK
jgi:hypothetical protein